MGVFRTLFREIIDRFYSCMKDLALVFINTNAQLQHFFSQPISIRQSSIKYLQNCIVSALFESPIGSLFRAVLLCLFSVCNLLIVFSYFIQFTYILRVISKNFRKLRANFRVLYGSTLFLGG